MASSKAGERPGSRSWGKPGRNPGLGAEPCLQAFIQPSEFLHPPGVSCDLGDPEVSSARLPSRLSWPRPGDLLSTRARREKARLQGSCEMRRDRASRGDVRVRRTSRGRHAVPQRVRLLLWRSSFGESREGTFFGYNSLEGSAELRTRGRDTHHTLFRLPVIIYENRGM